MKLRILFTPSIAVALLGTAALMLWCLAVVSPLPYAAVALPLALFYSALLVMSGWSLWRIHAIERWATWETPRRLLILAPHEDDCVISAGAIGARNRALGGITRIVYLAPDDAPGMRELRTMEAAEAWQMAGVGAEELIHLDLLPPLRQRAPQRLRKAAVALRSIIDDFEPAAIVMPMFEGGHVHHDMVAGLIGCVVTPHDRFEVFEAPEYSPFTSLEHTPHRVIALCTRWLGIVSYYGPPDGIDGRPMLKFRFTAEELGRKRRMLSAFRSQNGSSLAETRAYCDRLVRWAGRQYGRSPFELAGSYLGLALAARRVLPSGAVDRLFAVQPGTVGREGSLTNWAEEFGAAERSQ
jgi:LmbE family N-acetylglucosaminyl deacetylase